MTELKLGLVNLVDLLKINALLDMEADNNVMQQSIPKRMVMNIEAKRIVNRHWF